MLRLITCLVLYCTLSFGQSYPFPAPFPVVPPVIPPVVAPIASLVPTAYPFAPTPSPLIPGVAGYRNPLVPVVAGYNNPRVPGAAGYNNPLVPGVAGYNNPYYNQYSRTPGAAVPILTYSSDHAGDGTYSFSLTTADGKQAQEAGYLKDAYIDNAGEPQGTQVRIKCADRDVVQGSYAYISPEGTPIQVSYIADENGGSWGAPYMREARPMSHLRQIPGAGGGMHSQGMGMRNGGMGGGYDRSMERPMASGGGYDDRYGGYGGEDRRGFALMESRDPYAAPAPMYGEDRRGGYGAAGMDDMSGMYGEERRAPMYPDEMDMMDRRPMGRGSMPMAGGYDRGAAARPAPMGNGDMFSRRSPMRGGAAPAGGYERDPYAQQYPSMGRGGGAPARSGGMGPRRY